MSQLGNKVMASLGQLGLEVNLSMSKVSTKEDCMS